MADFLALTAILKEQGRPADDIILVTKAFHFADDIHRGFKRISGLDYIEHPLAVAARLAQMRMPTHIIAAALLHDVIEESNHPQEESRRKLTEAFDEDIAGLVQHVTKLDFKNAASFQRLKGMERYVENMRKMFIAFASDLRAIIIKFADRIENLRDLEILPAPKRLRIALETLEVYAPIANRLGMANFRVELEDMSFRHALPEEYQKVIDLVGKKYESREGYLEQIGIQVQKRLEAAGIQSIVAMQARTKHFYSLYKKLLKYDWDVDRIWDLFAIRIIAKEVPDCYAALGVIHSVWKPVKGRIKDYISQPKPNGYRSLHTTIFCDEGEFVEFQIRTQEMHDEAQYGVAAHWRYDEHLKGKKQAPIPAKRVDWVQELVNIQKEIEGNKQFLETLEHMKIDAFRDRIFVYTPKGDVIELPEHATPVDFAYAVHTDIGNKCMGAIVNEKHVPLDTPLHSGDMIQILIEKNRKGPSSDWLKFVKTRHAREQVRTHAKSTIVDFLKSMIPKGKAK
jgi:GTP pyrophosphokinase